MQKLIQTVTLLIVSVWGVATHAFPLCSADYLNACVDLSHPDCLNKYHACGQYEAIINHFATAAMSEPLTAYYYQGVAFYGLFLRHRARSLKCEYARVARSNLRGYLGQMEQRFNHQGHFGTEPHAKIYQATKLYDKLKTVSGCLDSGWSERDIRYRTRTYINEALEGLFFQTATRGALADQLKTAKEAIYNAINGFVSKAAAIETQLALRRIELQASQRRIKTIIELYEQGGHNNGFGQANPEAQDDKIIQVRPQVTANAAFQAAIQKVAEQAGRVAAKKQAFDEALGKQSIDQYEQARSAILVKATETINKAVSLTGVSQEITLPETQARPTSESELEQIHQNIRQRWRQYGEQHYYCTTPDTMVWFCEK